MASRNFSKGAQMNIPPELDFCSASFDAAKAIAAENIYLPYPKAKTYNNIAEYYSHFFLKKASGNVSSKTLKKDKRSDDIQRNYDWFHATLKFRWSDDSYVPKKYKRRKGKVLEFFEKRRIALQKYLSRCPKKAVSFPPLRSNKSVTIKVNRHIFKSYFKKAEFHNLNNVVNYSVQKKVQSELTKGVKSNSEEPSDQYNKHLLKNERQCEAMKNIYCSNVVENEELNSMLTTLCNNTAQVENVSRKGTKKASESSIEIDSKSEIDQSAISNNVRLETENNMKKISENKDEIINKPKKNELNSDGFSSVLLNESKNSVRDQKQVLLSLAKAAGIHSIEELYSRVKQSTTNDSSDIHGTFPLKPANYVAEKAEKTTNLKSGLKQHNRNAKNIMKENIPNNTSG